MCFLFYFIMDFLYVHLFFSQCSSVSYVLFYIFIHMFFLDLILLVTDYSFLLITRITC